MMAVGMLMVIRMDFISVFYSEYMYQVQVSIPVTVRPRCKRFQGRSRRKNKEEEGPVVVVKEEEEAGGWEKQKGDHYEPQQQEMEKEKEWGLF
jgi:hypothetical protein